MNGKTLKVKVSQLEFGTSDRYVNILGCFKYIPNGNIYIVYTDTDLKYNVVHYGNGHVRQGGVLCMSCRSKDEEEVIKEYIFKVSNNEGLESFEAYPLGDVSDIEIIGSTKLEIKMEVLLDLVGKVIPKEEKEEVKEVKSKKKKKKKSFGSVLLGIIIAFIILGGIYYIVSMFTTDIVAKSITCSKSYPDDSINAVVIEENKYSFNVTDTLEGLETTYTYQFTEEAYNEFFLRGIHYKYMENSDDWSKDDIEYIFRVITKRSIDSSYDEPKDYEEAIKYYKDNGYSCIEEIER